MYAPCIHYEYYNSETLVLVWEKNLVQGLHKRTRWRTLYRIYPYLYTLVLGLCYDCATPTLKSMLPPHVLLLIHHKATMPCICALMSYFLISTVHVYTMRNHCSLTSSLTLTPTLDSSQSFQTLSPSRLLQTTPAYIT